MKVSLFVLLIFLLPSFSLAEQTAYNQYIDSKKQNEQMREQTLYDSQAVIHCLEDIQFQNKDKGYDGKTIDEIRKCLVSFITYSFESICKEQEKFSFMKKADQERLGDKKDQQIIAVSDAIEQVRLDTDLGRQTIVAGTWNDDFWAIVMYVIPSMVGGGVGGAVIATAGGVARIGINSFRVGKLVKTGKQVASTGIKGVGTKTGLGKKILQGGVSGAKGGAVFTGGMSGYQALARPIIRQQERDAYIRTLGFKADSYPQNPQDDDYPLDICDIEDAFKNP